MSLPKVPPEVLQKMLDAPAHAPPAGVIPNFIDPPSLHTTSLVIVIVCLIIPTIAVWMRLYTKGKIVKSITLEDYVLLLGWVCYVGAYYVCAFLIIDYLPGVHQWDVQVKAISKYLYYLHIGTLMYGITILFIKLSILIQWIRVFLTPASRGPMFWAFHALIWANIIFYVSCTFIEVWSCNPRAKIWTPLLQGGKCLNTNAIAVSSGVFNTISDIAMVLLPQRVIWKLNMSRGRKIGLSAIFLFGILACIASLVRLYYCVRVFESHDYTYYTLLMALGSFPEMTAGFLVICLPVLPKFVRSMFGEDILTRVGFTKFRSYFYTSSGSGNAASGSGRWRNLRFLNSPSVTGKEKSAVEATLERNDSGAAVEVDAEKEKADACIVRTVQIAAEDGPRRSGDFEARFQATHPWAKEEVPGAAADAFDERNIGFVGEEDSFI
ncbi:hypothetical protein BU16DRAFT_613535 [Lophium mytilinum]|uniref:Rhodopsin domain-containing protein n=1 Tax=Lophium mytilinum TaxID=390894 RepID=A0A6A6RA28_9PEZI|nr:hypothetical protein BU16DRAFT_613535 [Lophium mytilinum]